MDYFHGRWPRRRREWGPVAGCLAAAVLCALFMALTAVLFTWKVEPHMFGLWSFRTAVCSTSDVTNNSSQVSCSCGHLCLSQYRCVQIRVNYTDEDGLPHSRIVLRDTVDDRRQERNCSIAPCSSRDPVENNLAVEQFLNKFENGTFICLYNPDHPHEVFVKRKAGVFHYVLWPGLLCLVCLFLCVVLTPPCVRAIKNHRARVADSEGLIN